MKQKITIYDVAEKSGYSIATVNRALSNKARISDKTKAYIIKTAEEMGYKPSKAAVGLSRTPIKIGVIIHSVIHAFSEEILMGVKKAFSKLEDFNVKSDIYFLEGTDDSAALSKIDDMIEDGVSAILILPPENDAVLNARIRELNEKNIVTATVVSDLSDVAFSVRNNGIVSGKMAAEMLKMMVGQRQVAVVTGNKEKAVHRDTIFGFETFCRENGIDFVGVYEHNDNPQTAYRLVDQIIDDHPDIAGVYLGSANSTTFCRRVVELGYDKKLKIVASDIFAELIDYLRKDVVQATIFQNPYNQGRLAVRYLYEMMAEGRVMDRNIFLDPQLVIKSNVGSFVQKADTE